MLMSKNVNNESMTTADIRFSAQTDSSVNHPGTGCKAGVGGGGGGGGEIGAIFFNSIPYSLPFFN